MTIRPSRKELEYVTSKIFEAIQKGQVPGVTPNDVRLITEPEHLALYDMVDLGYRSTKTANEIIGFFKKSTENYNPGTK